MADRESLKRLGNNTLKGLLKQYKIPISTKSQDEMVSAILGYRKGRLEIDFPKPTFDFFTDSDGKKETAYEEDWYAKVKQINDDCRELELGVAEHRLAELPTKHQGHADDLEKRMKAKMAVVKARVDSYRPVASASTSDGPGADSVTANTTEDAQGNIMLLSSAVGNRESPPDEAEGNVEIDEEPGIDQIIKEADSSEVSGDADANPSTSVPNSIDSRATKKRKVTPVPTQGTHKKNFPKLRHVKGIYQPPDAAPQKVEDRLTQKPEIYTIPYLFLANTEMNVRGEHVSLIKGLLENDYPNLHVRADATGYFIFFEMDGSGEAMAKFLKQYEKGFFVLLKRVSPKLVLPKWVEVLPLGSPLASPATGGSSKVIDLIQ